MNILHKLGLYKKSEIDGLIAKAAALTNSIDGVIEDAKLDRQCYKAAISAFRDVNTVEHAVKVIGEYCGNQESCVGCKANKGGCEFAHTSPDWWDLSEVSK